MAGLFPQNIGKTMPNGFAGSYARQPDMIIATRALGGSDALTFGVPLKYDADGKVVLFGAGSAAADFVGVAAAEVKSATSYLNQTAGEYTTGDAVAVFQRGAVNVLCKRGTAALGGDVYIRIAANATYPNAAIGDFEASADGVNSVKLTNCQWAGGQDGDNVAELRILTMANA